jgi:hypothetical protein
MQKAQRVTFIRVSAKLSHRIFHPAARLAQVRFTFLLSHAFVLPGTAKQHQPHPPSDQELYARASRLGCTDDRSASTALRSWGLVATPEGNIHNPPIDSPAAQLSSTRELMYAALHSKRMGQWSAASGQRPHGLANQRRYQEHGRDNGPLLLVRGVGQPVYFA